MSNYLTETQILNKLNIPDFRHMTKDKIIALYEQSKTLHKSYEEEINSILNYDESLMQQYSQYEEKVVKMLVNLRKTMTKKSISSKSYYH